MNFTQKPAGEPEPTKDSDRNPLHPMKKAIIAILLLGPAGVTDGQVPDPALPFIYVPVDQAIEDVDPAGSSLRRVEAGLRGSGEQTSVFQAVPLNGQPQPPGTKPTYYRLGPGFRAITNRLNYLVITNPFPQKQRLEAKDTGFNASPALDGMFLELVPDGTVYDLRPIQIRPAQRRPYPVDTAPRTDIIGTDPNDQRIDLFLKPTIDGDLHHPGAIGTILPTARPAPNRNLKFPARRQLRSLEPKRRRPSVRIRRRARNEGREAKSDERRAKSDEAEQKPKETKHLKQGEKTTEKKEAKD